jgi:uncharacterized protein (TIGR01777 family)
MRVTITGATGLIGSRLVRELQARGDEVTVLSRDPDAATGRLGVEAVRWDPEREPAPAEALRGRDGVVHLAGENVAQRWSAAAKRRIRDSRELGTRHLVQGISNADPRPSVLVSASAVGYYGFHGDEPLPEDAPPGPDFLAQVCVAWEREAEAAGEHGVRVVRLRNGVVLDRGGGALGKMLPFFKAAVGGPVAGGRQRLPWIHADDVVGVIVQALADERYRGAVNTTAPNPPTNREFSKALGRALGRPAIAPIPAPAIRLLYGDMAEIVTEGQNAIPRRLEELGYAYRHPQLDAALHDALGG